MTGFSARIGWRKQANLARVLAGVGVEALGMDDGKRTGELLALAASADVVDAHVALADTKSETFGDKLRRRYASFS